MTATRQRRRLAAILAADVAGYTAAMEADETGTLDQLRAMLRHVVMPAVAEHHGRVFKTMGDGFLAEFPSAVDAAQCAAAIRAALAARSAPLRLRIGLHVGDVIVEGDDLFGDGVNIAARLEAEAEPGGVVASDAFRRHVEGRAGLAFEDIGARRLKHVAEPVRLHRLAGAGTPARPRRAWPPPRRAAIAAVALAAIALGAFWAAPRFMGGTDPGTVDGVPGAPTIAVLPFENLSPGPEQVFFAEGLAEDLIVDLSRIEGVRVISRTSSFAVDTALPAAEIARRLKARYLLEGSVRRAGDRLRITTSLIDTASDTPVWAERFDGATSDVFGFQDRITESLVGALSVELTPSERQVLARPETRSPEAYDAYLRGLRLLADRKKLAAEANAEAQAAFEEAIRLDPDYALAYAGLAWAKWVYIEAVNDYGSPDAAFALAERSLTFAENALAHRTLAMRHFPVLNPRAISTASRNPGAAVVALESARRLQPGNPDVLADLALVLPFDGRPDEAARLVRRAMELNPDHPDWYFAATGIASLLGGDTKVAVRDLGRWADSVPAVPSPKLFLAAALGVIGRGGEAEAALADALRLGADRTIAATMRRWPMKEAEREIFAQGLAAAGMAASVN